MAEIPSRTVDDSADREPVEWYLAFVLYALKPDASQSTIAQKCVYLIRANKHQEAYDRTLEWASPNQNSWRGSECFVLPLVGIVELMPVWEPVEHGSELGFSDLDFECWDDLTDQILDRSNLE